MSSTFNSLSSLPPSPPSPPPSSMSTNLSLLVIFFLLVFIIAITISIHLLLRFISRHPIPSPSLMHLNSTSSTYVSTSMTTSTTSSSRHSTPHYNALVNSLPLFTLATLPSRPSTDCAVCLSRFRNDDKLRLLPACRHAFHSACIDKWLHSTPSCPLCRSSIERHPIVLPPPLPSPPTPTSVDEAALIGQWLKEYVDRLASAATTPFSSMRFSACGSRRFDFEEGSAVDGRSVSLEINGEESFRSSSESGYFASAYKWMAMARE